MGPEQETELIAKLLSLSIIQSIENLEIAVAAASEEKKITTIQHELFSKLISLVMDRLSDFFVDHFLIETQIDFLDELLEDMVANETLNELKLLKEKHIQIFDQTFSHDAYNFLVKYRALVEKKVFGLNLPSSADPWESFKRQSIENLLEYLSKRRSEFNFFNSDDVRVREKYLYKLIPLIVTDNEQGQKELLNDQNIAKFKGFFSERMYEELVKYRQAFETQLTKMAEVPKREMGKRN